MNLLNPRDPIDDLRCAVCRQYTPTENCPCRQPEKRLGGSALDRLLTKLAIAVVIGTYLYLLYHLVLWCLRRLAS